MKRKLLTKLKNGKAQTKIKKLNKFTKLPGRLKALGFAFPREFMGAVLTDSKGSPKYFVFDTYSLWDLLCAFDAKLEENVSTEEYVYSNPVGWFIDAIEAHLPINPKIAMKLKEDFTRLNKSDLVPIEEIERELKAA